MAAPYRTTQMGACASCGAYGGSQHRPTCGPRTGPRIQFGPSRTGTDPRLSAAALARILYERAMERLIDEHS